MKSAKERVKEKFDIASDIKDAKIKTSIRNVELVDGKLKADFDISGLPADKKSSFESSYKSIPKIFNDFDEFSLYAKAFFSKTDEELIKLCKESY